ncbi:MAG: RHS repeat-associated core domain-containing protein [Bacteroidales bacterium]|nr:RHS repeat-associated core domain-containing protein [Bacteroidales bacterium]
MNQPAHKTDPRNCTFFGHFSELSFTGKERDSETGFSYFGARYYDSDLSGLFLSVDPMSDKYPSISPYAYCAWNPVKLVDPDGEKIVAYNKKTEAYINKYMNQLFGSSDLFYFNKNGVLKINKSEFKNYYNNIATEDQIKLLNGIKKCIKISKKTTIIVQENNNKFKLYGRDDLYECEPEIVLVKGSGATSTDELPGLGHIIFINDRGDNNTDFFSSGTDSYGNLKKVQTPVSTAFIHELLDEFYNTIVTGKISKESPGIDKVRNQNVALRILGKDERDGNDHNY